jgi:hypothetical protein
VSPRLIGNIIYVHLRSQASHVDKCTERGCPAECGFRRLEDWLSAPLLPSDAADDDRRRQRLEALMRGEIPA